MLVFNVIRNLKDKYYKNKVDQCSYIYFVCSYWYTRCKIKNVLFYFYSFMWKYCWFVPMWSY
jgi:hypothetical protein